MISISDKIFPSSVRKGVVKDKSKVNFIVENHADLDFEGYYQDCGCLGTLTISPRQLTCELEAAFKGVSVELITDGNVYWRMIPVGATSKAFNVHTNQYDIEIPDNTTPVAAFLFDRNIPIYFDDGELVKVFQNGSLKDNPKKHVAYVNVTFYVIQ